MITDIFAGEEAGALGHKKSSVMSSAEKLKAEPFGSALLFDQMMPRASMASATRTKPATLAPRT